MVYSLNLPIFKKSSPNKKITVYLSKRDYYKESIDPIEGIVHFKGNDLKGFKIYGQFVCSFRYGLEEDELMGIRFQKDIILDAKRISTSLPNENPTKLSKFQEKIIMNLKKDKEDCICYPFKFKIPPKSPHSVKIYSGPDEKPFGIEYFVIIYIGQNKMDNLDVRNKILFEIRLLQNMPNIMAQAQFQRQDSSSLFVTRKNFLISPGQLELETSLNKSIYNQGEKVLAKVTIRNFTSRNHTINKIKIDLFQSVNVTVLHNGPYKISINSTLLREELNISAGNSMQKVIYLCPSFTSCTAADQRGIAINGNIINNNNYGSSGKKKDYINNTLSLASSTFCNEADESLLRSRSAAGSNEDFQFGIIVSYSVRVKIYLGPLRGSLRTEMPFQLVNYNPNYTISNYQKLKQEVMNKNSDEPISFLEEVIKI